MTINEHITTFAGRTVREFPPEGAVEEDPGSIAWRIEDPDFEGGEIFAERLEQLTRQEWADRVSALVLGEWGSAYDTSVPMDLLVRAISQLPSLEAIFLSILILISQNMDAAESERRHHLDLQMNLLAEREITALMRLVVEMARRGGVPEELTAEARSFAHDTDPSGVLAQIIRAEHRHHLVRPEEGKPAR